MPDPVTNTPASVMAQPSQVSPPAAAQQPARQLRSLYIVLIALLVAVVVGSGLLYAFLVPKGTTTPPPSNSVVGHVTFLSSPNAAPPGNIDEVEISIQHIPEAASGGHYYAWLQINSENSFPIGWPLTIHNGSLSSSPYVNRNLLTNKPYLLLITVEKAGTAPVVATLDPNARLYYAILPNNIQNAATFDIRPCPQGGSNNICSS